MAHGRRLAEVTLADGRNVNRELDRLGYASYLDYDVLPHHDDRCSPPDRYRPSDPEQVTLRR
jgi:hypothetical protein